MDDNTKQLLELVGIHFDDIDQTLVPREQLISNAKYTEVQKLIPLLKQQFSSSYMTSLQQNAGKFQKWPLLNLIRQILDVYHYDMTPIRKSDGYTPDGIKKYKRFFLIAKSTFGKVEQNTHIV